MEAVGLRGYFLGSPASVFPPIFLPFDDYLEAPTTNSCCHDILPNSTTRNIGLRDHRRDSLKCEPKEILHSLLLNVRYSVTEVRGVTYTHG